MTTSPARSIRNALLSLRTSGASLSRKEQGFTLIELMVSMVIMAGLAASATTIMIFHLNKATEAELEAELNMAADSVRTHISRFPYGITDDAINIYRTDEDGYLIPPKENLGIADVNALPITHVTAACDEPTYLRPHLNLRTPETICLTVKGTYGHYVIKASYGNEDIKEGMSLAWSSKLGDLEVGSTAIEVDYDFDGLSDYDEQYVYLTSYRTADTDLDGLLDGAEIDLGTSPLHKDSDGDQLLDGKEVNTYGSDALKVDTDGDQLSDNEEVTRWGTSPVKVDSDNDGLSDFDEIRESKTEPLIVDTDLDSVSDGDEVLIHGTNPLVNPAKYDSDSDGLNDALETSIGTSLTNKDSDGDGRGDRMEHLSDSYDPLVHEEGRDSDLDGLPDLYELSLGLNPNSSDSDGDGYGDNEDHAKADALNPDTDGDGLLDGLEVYTYFTQPKVVDSDDDRLSDGEEVLTHKTDPNYWDSDGDLLSDYDEVHVHGTKPLSIDSDNDNVRDDAEVREHGTDPLAADSDGDGYGDGIEIAYGSSPLDDNSRPEK